MNNMSYMQQLQFDRIEKKLDRIIQQQERELIKMAKLDDAITALTAEVSKDTTVIASAITLIKGIAAQIQAAVDAALAAGATPAQLKALTDLQASVAANDTALAAAVAAGTPPPPPVTTQSHPK